jgi:peroxiredoxin Q/BCP
MKLRTLLTTLCSLLGLTLGAQAATLEVGSPAPDITAVDQDGKSVSFKAVYEKGPTLVYFYPKADTPGCTKQACSLRDDWSEIKPDSQKAFQDKYKLPFTLVADHDSKVADAFGVPHLGGFSKRQSFLIKDSKVVWVMPAASTATHSKDVLAAYEKLGK